MLVQELISSYPPIFMCATGSLALHCIHLETNRCLPARVGCCRSLRAVAFDESGGVAARRMLVVVADYAVPVEIPKVYTVFLLDFKYTLQGQNSWSPTIM
ncbi:hypothetical protein AYI69_g9724 [Smittium culicis]|uniref:Uncharacterized protein n=1 Tax=Smittium culicis TaxID=133412 RepID=A0A1R1XAV1_9FUNG|nr:hypothetical protein AYI69_g9724 [Smittium culicis]